jgi:hypothetical protein
MTRHVLFATAVLAALSCSIPRWPAAQPAPAPAPQAASTCPPDEAVAQAGRLARVAGVLKPGGTLEILAIGSATMLGPQGGPEGSVPDRMAQDLRRAVPGAAVRLTARGGRGVTAQDMVAAMSEELAHRRYQLVLWQTGTVEAARNLPPAEFAATLADGMRRTRAADADLILIDPQFSRLLTAKANLAPYEETLERAAAGPDVVLFHRFALMRRWVETTQIDIETATRADREETVDRLHECLARALARVVLHDAEPAAADATAVPPGR